MTQARKPKGSPNGAGGQFDTTGHAGQAGTPPMLDMVSEQWPADGIGTVRDVDLSDRDAMEILNMDWHGITLADSDLRDTHVTPLDLPYDPDAHGWAGPTFTHTLFGFRQGYAANYTRMTDGSRYATVTVPGQPARSTGSVDWQLQVAADYDVKDDELRHVTNVDEMRVDADEWRQRQTPPVDRETTTRMADTLAKFIDEDHGVWCGTDIPANMDTVNLDWVDDYLAVHDPDDEDEDEEDW